MSAATPPSQADRHAVVLGGTGMLRDVTLTLAKRGMNVTVLARNPHRTRELCRVNPDRLHPVLIDWHETTWLETRLRDALAERGAASLAVCWCHTTAPEAPPLLSRLVGGEDRDQPCRFVHVLGSSAPATNPVKGDWVETIGHMASIEYQTVQLGCERLGGLIRWLEHPVICKGVLSAIDSGEPETFVGEPIP